MPSSTAPARDVSTDAEDQLRIAYLVGTYPAVSHTFISREVAGLRGLGVDVHTFSVRRAPADQLLTDEARHAAEQTRSIQPPRARPVLGAHLRAFVHAPGRYARTLLLALRSSPGGLRAKAWHFFYFAEAIILWDWLSERGIRHVHVHFANAATAIAMLYACYGEPDGASWSFTMHGPTEFDNVDSYLLAEKVRRARFVVCISDFARSQLMKLTESDHWHKLSVVHCGIDPASFRPQARAERTSPERLTILCVGRLVPEKGHALLIEAFSLLPPELAPGVRLVIAGDGPERRALEHQAQALGRDRIAFAGAVREDELVALYADADVFCLPSLAEGLPVVLIEAMAMELPVLSTRVMGIPELVSDRTSGLVVPPGRPDALAGGLRELLEDGALRRALGKAGRERIVADYDIRRSVTQLSDLLREACVHGLER